MGEGGGWETAGGVREGSGATAERQRDRNLKTGRQRQRQRKLLPSSSTLMVTRSLLADAALEA
eukprot:1891094-Rhodomonas_salina.1